jgi:hypothetical protein
MRLKKEFENLFDIVKDADSYRRYRIAWESCEDTLLPIIDKLKAEIEELKNRSCENCKHYNIDKVADVCDTCFRSNAPYDKDHWEAREGE